MGGFGLYSYLAEKKRAEDKKLAEPDEIGRTLSMCMTNAEG